MKILKTPHSMREVSIVQESIAETQEATLQGIPPEIFQGDTKV